MAKVTIRYWAAAKHAAGTGEETVSAETLADALYAARARREGDQRFASILGFSSFLIDGESVSQTAADAVSLSEGVTVEVLPPFAGG